MDKKIIQKFNINILSSTIKIYNIEDNKKCDFKNYIK